VAKDRSNNRLTDANYRSTLTISTFHTSCPFDRWADGRARHV